VTATTAPIPLGRLVMTNGVAELIASDDGQGVRVLAWIARHARNDCPNLSEHDRQANEDAIRDGDRVLTHWTLPTADGDVKVYVITEWDRSLTTVLRADEY
jgi:hypothetical protein